MPERATGNYVFQDLNILTGCRGGGKNCEIILLLYLKENTKELDFFFFTFCNIIVRLTNTPAEMGEVKAKICGILKLFALLLDSLSKRVKYDWWSCL